MISAEQGLLSIFISKYGVKYFYLLDKLKTEFFTDIPRRKIFNCIKSMYENNEEIDPILIAERTGETEELDDILTCDSLSINAELYANEIFNKFIAVLIEGAKTEKEFQQIKTYQEEYNSLNNKIKKISDGIQDIEEDMARRSSNCVFSYMGKLDDYIGAFMGGDYIVFGAGTGVGKTMFALNLCQRACIQEKKVLYFSLEMPLAQLQNRFVCMCEGLNAMKYRACGFNLEELAKYKQGMENLKQWDVEIVNDYKLTPEKMRYYIKISKPDFVVVDYLGLMSGYGNRSMYEKTTCLSREMKLIASEFNVPMLVLVQLNRNNKERAEKRPILSDIRESGAIEQDADFVLFGYRELDNEFEVIIGKNRHGISNKIVKLPLNLSCQQIGGK